MALPNAGPIPSTQQPAGMQKIGRVGLRLPPSNSADCRALRDDFPTRIRVIEHRKLDPDLRDQPKEVRFPQPHLPRLLPIWNDPRRRVAAQAVSPAVEAVDVADIRTLDPGDGSQTVINRVADGDSRFRPILPHRGVHVVTAASGLPLTRDPSRRRDTSLRASWKLPCRSRAKSDSGEDSQSSTSSQSIVARCLPVESSKSPSRKSRWFSTWSASSRSASASSLRASSSYSSDRGT
jgi:hypothetical protein